MEAELAEQARRLAAEIIGNWFLRTFRKRIFNRLKRALCEAQRCLALDLLKQLCPREAQLLSDPTFQPVLRLRFGGSKFPPNIYYKVFLKQGSTSIQYFSGKKYIRAATDAAQDACKQMGPKQFLSQVLDDMHQARSGCFDELDVATLKDYMKLSSTTDNTAASLGGRDNTWRCLTADASTPDGVLADFFAYTQTGRTTSVLSAALPRLQPSPLTLSPDTSSRLWTERAAEAARALNRDPAKRHTRSQRTQRLDHMRRLYGLSKSPAPSATLSASAASFSTVGYHLQGSPAPEPLPDDEEWSAEEGELYQWSQDLPLDDAALAAALGDL